MLLTLGSDYEKAHTYQIWNTSTPLYSHHMFADTGAISIWWFFVWISDVVKNVNLVYNTYDYGMKTGSGGVRCHNAQGRVRNSKSNLEGVRPRDLKYCSHKPECIVTTNPYGSILIAFITCHFQFRPMNASILYLKCQYRARSESRFACFSHCYVTWCPLTLRSWRASSRLSYWRV